MRSLPVFIINGFIESGKTELISEIISRDGFNKRGSTLLIVFEEGIVEYDDKELLDYSTIAVHLDESEATLEKIDYYCDLYDPDRVVIEMNSMIDKTNLKYPDYFSIQQEITLIDASTFTMYFNNMRQIFSDMIRRSDVVIFNRCNDIDVLSNYRMSVRALNNDCEVAFLDTNRKYIENLPEDYPYDMNSTHIDIMDDDYGFFYFDCNDNPDLYLDKLITLRGFALTSDDLPNNHFIISRLANTCCADDISVLGIEVVNNTDTKVKQKDWYEITVTVKNEYSIAIADRGPVLYIKSIKKIDEIENPILDFSK